jgi:hypothetical protein
MIVIAITLAMGLGTHHAYAGLGTHHAYADTYESCPDGYHFNDVYNTCVLN